MRSLIRKCTACGRYTLSDTCPACTGKTATTVPPRFSPDDPYGRYRRITIEQERGDNGKHRKI